MIKSGEKTPRFLSMNFWNFAKEALAVGYALLSSVELNMVIVNGPIRLSPSAPLMPQMEESTSQWADLEGFMIWLMVNQALFLNVLSSLACKQYL